MAKKAVLNSKTAEVEGKISYITNLPTKTALDIKVADIENNLHDIVGFITTPELSRLTKTCFDARIKKQ